MTGLGGATSAAGVFGVLAPPGVNPLGVQGDTSELSRKEVESERVSLLLLLF